MFETYMVNGKPYEVSPDRLNDFLTKFPNATKVDEPGKTNDSTMTSPSVGSNAMGSSLGDGSLEQPESNPAGNWFSDAWFAGEINADMYDDADNVFDIGSAEDARKLTDEELNTYIGLLQKSKAAAGEMKEAQKFAEAYNKYDAQGENMMMSTIMGVRDVGIKGFAQNMIQSMRGQFNTQQLLESGAAGVAGGTAGSFVPIVGTGIGATTSFFAAANYGMETIHMFNQLLEEEVKNAGLEFTPENIRKIMSNDEIRSKIKSKARKRGGTIAAVEGFTGLLGMKGAGKIIQGGMRTTSLVGKTGRYLGAGAVNVGTEVLGGGGGEYLGAKAAGMEATGLDIVNEAFSGVATTAPISTAVSAGVALKNRPGYFVEGKKVTKKSLLDYTDRAQTPQELADLNFEIKNDPLLDADLRKKQLRANIDTQIDPSITDVNKRNKLIDLQIEKTKLEQDKSKFKISNTKKKIEKVNQDIEDVLSGVTDVETTGVKEQLQKGVQQYSIQNTIKLLENEAGPIPNIKEAFAVEDDKSAQAAFEKIRAEFGLEEQDVTNSDGFIVPTPEGNIVIINKDIAGKTGQINVGGHELLHAIVQKHYNSLGDGSVAQRKFIEDFKNTISKKSLKYIQDIIDGRNRDTIDSKTGETIKGEGLTSYSDEYLTIYSDGIVKKQIGYDESVGIKLKNFIQDVARSFYKAAGVDYGKEFGSGLDTYNFMRDYNKSIMEFNTLSERAKSVAGVEAVGTKVKGSVTPKRDLTPAQTTKEINDLGKQIIDKDGTITNLEKEGEGNFYFKAEAKNIYKKIQEQGLLDNLILKQPHAGVNDKTFLDTTYAELFSWFEKYQPERQNPSGLFGHINPQIANRAKQAYNSITKGQVTAPTVDIGQTTKEGEVKVQVAAETDAAMEALETEDLSPAARAKKKADKAKVKEKVESEFRKEIGIETGSELYNKVLDSARKALLRAYEAGTSVRNIQRKLRDEASVYLFKSVKNFLGTKDYVKNLKKFREPIVKAIFTADLVQLERNVADSDRILTTFVKKLTSKQEVEDAVNQKLLPPSALNIIDKGTAVSLYKKKMPTEKQFLSFFYTPLINPVTGARSGLRGTRKDGLAKAMAGALSYDATMEVAQEQDVIEKREQLAALKGETLAQDNLETLAAAIGRDPNVKFSKSNENRIVSNMAGEILSLVNEMSTDPSLITFKNGIYKINQNIIKKWTRKAKFKKSDEAIIAEFAYKMYRDNAYGKLTNFELAKKVLKDVIKARKNKYDLKVNQAFEQLVISSLQYAVKNINSRLKTNKKVKEGVGQGDAYISFNRNILGIEVKMNEADGVSQTVNIKVDGDGKYSLTYANPNPTINENKQKFDDLIGKKILNATKQLNSDLKKAGLGPIAENTILTKAQIKFIEDNVLKTHFLQHMEISPEYAMWHYGNAKYQNKPQGFIQVGESLYRMITGNRNIDGLSYAIQQEYKGVIPNLSTNSSSTMEMVARLKIDNGKLKWRISPRIIDTQLTESKVNLLNSKDANAFVKAADKVMVNFSKSQDAQTIGKAVQFSRSANNPTKGITVLDFDDTLATTKSLVKFTRPDGTTGTLNAEQYASTYENLLDQGYTFDFSEFNKVVKGKLAPLFKKAIKLQGKFGPENMFVLTARPPQAAKAIFDFLKANGLNIPLKNITGLANSTAEAKALWVADKVGEGYNDFYFADDALQNVQAVKNMLDQFDVKSKVQQARVKFSKNMDTEFNNILEDVTGIESIKRFSIIKGRKRGESKGKFRYFVPPSHEDFVGLLYNFMGKGREGDKHRDFLEQALVRPLNRANRELDTARQSIANDYKALNKQFILVKEKLTKKTPDGDFVFQDAIRVYLWDKHGHKIPGLSETDQTKLAELVMSDPQLQAYAETLNIISKQENYVAPTDGWNSGDIRMDLDDATGRIGREQYFSEFIENADIVFSEENLNKIEAGYGEGVRESLEDMLYRIKTGRNRPSGSNKQVNNLMNFLNGSVGTVMFFNMRSALLQQMSIVNYINFADNNIFAAAKAFANQKQYWADWSFIFNSDMLKQRRGGIQTDVNGAELAASLRNSKNPTRKLISKLLELGFLPTQIGDNIAIATGGASYYRNRINTYLKQGLSQKEAEAKAFTDFQDTTQSTQQSARPDMVSKQQASVIGKVILNFQNVTSQFNRLGKKAFQDIYNRRITKPNTTQMQSDISNASRITYYFAVQNLIFYTLQTAMFAMMFDDDEEDVNNLFLKKRERLINGSIDSVLRGTGLIGGVVATLKNVAIAFARQRDVNYNPDESAVIVEALNLSPVIGIKARQVVNAEKTLNYNKKVIDEMETFDIDNPQWSAVTNYVQTFTNIPLNRLYNKTQNARQSLNNDHAAWERTLMFLGWSQYNLNLENKKMEEIKEKTKSKKKKKKSGLGKSTLGKRL